MGVLCYYSKLDRAPFKRSGCKKKPTHRLYSDFISKNSSVCPFCGINNYKNEFGKRREDLDHYLYKNKYPFAAANMDNLVPTCSECNQDYKKTIDVLFDRPGKSGKRVVAYYPYSKTSGVTLAIDLDVGLSCKKPIAWNISLAANDTSEQDKVDNWKRVFGIEERYQNEIVKYHDEWMESALRERKSEFEDDNQFRTFMLERAAIELESFKRKMTPSAYLRRSFFEFMANNADKAFIGKYMQPFNAGVL